MTVELPWFAAAEACELDKKESWQHRKRRERYR